MSCRRDFKLDRPSIRIAIASLLLAVWRRPVRLRNIPIRILQILPADARLGPRRALPVSSAAERPMGSSVSITLERRRLLSTDPDSYPTLKYP